MADDTAPVKGVTSNAELLAAFLHRNGITQVAAAAALGVSGPTVYDWIAGKKRPRTHLREAIALWTNGEVPTDGWLEESERATVAGVRPFVPADDESDPALAPPSSDPG